VCGALSRTKRPLGTERAMSLETFAIWFQLAITERRWSVCRVFGFFKSSLVAITAGAGAFVLNPVSAVWGLARGAPFVIVFLAMDVILAVTARLYLGNGKNLLNAWRDHSKIAVDFSTNAQLVICESDLRAIQRGVGALG